MTMAKFEILFCILLIAVTSINTQMTMVNDMMTTARSASSCILSNAYITSIPMDILNGIFSCGKNTITDLISDSKSTVTEFTESINDLVGIASNLTSCLSDLSNLLPCVSTTLFSDASSTVIKLAKIAGNTAALVTKFPTLPVSIQTCLVTGAGDALKNETQHVYSVVKDCIANPESTTS